MQSPLSEWWTEPMGTELGQRIHDLFEHPCDGLPYAPSGFHDKDGAWVRVEDVIQSVRNLEAAEAPAAIQMHKEWE